MSAPSVHCAYFAAGSCRSCVLIETPYDRQLAQKVARCSELLPAVRPESWLLPVAGGERDFRNKAKLVVGGKLGSVKLGILGPDQAGVDLRECLIQTPGIRSAIPRIANFLNETGLEPYDVPARRGELKFVHVTEAPTGAEASGAALMLRFVVRTRHGLGQLERALGALRGAVPEATVISVNLLPEHKAVLEGDDEVWLFGSSLDMHLGQISLHLQPQSFFQTNTAVATALYNQVAVWVDQCAPALLWDLYCGVGGFALHCAAPGRRVLGVELSEAAVASARRSAADAGFDGEVGDHKVEFLAQDATEFALAASEVPDLVIVNPPRRGIGAELAEWLESEARVGSVVYSSCNPESLAKDLAAMPSLEPVAGRVFDMFPHTKHLEVAVLLQRV